MVSLPRHKVTVVQISLVFVGGTKKRELEMAQWYYGKQSRSEV